MAHAYREGLQCHQIPLIKCLSIILLIGKIRPTQNCSFKYIRNHKRLWLLMFYINIMHEGSTLIVAIDIATQVQNHR